MDRLPHRHLTTLSLEVDFANLVGIGPIRAGTRGIATVTGGRFAGERLTGRVIGGQDWFMRREDASLSLDVRLTLATDDGATVYLGYTGQMLAAPEAMARFARGETLSADEYRLEATGAFECGVEQYRWLNDVIAVAVGEQTPAGPVYRFFEIGRD